MTANPVSIPTPVPVTCKYLLLVLVLLLLGGCSTLQYYGQSVRGHLDLMSRRDAIDALLADPQTPVELRVRLHTVLEIRDFASKSLALPENDSYRSYADLERDFVVWNVFATPALSLQPVEWCFLLVGCLHYRGYYAEDAARAYAAGLRDDGYDVHVAGAIAYSTLGWFNDPVLNTMLRLDDAQLARVIFHELAHQQLFVPGDTAYNEAFAETVALAGVERWLQASGRADALAGFRQALSYEEEFIALLLDYRGRLQALYDSDKPDSHKAAGKQALLAGLREAYETLRSDWGGYAGYDHWFDQEVNNARLAVVATYRELLPGFTALLADVDGDLARFYGLVEQLGGCSHAERRQVLAAGSRDFTC